MAVEPIALVVCGGGANEVKTVAGAAAWPYIAAYLGPHISAYWDSVVAIAGVMFCPSQLVSTSVINKVGCTIAGRERHGERLQRPLRPP